MAMGSQSPAGSPCRPWRRPTTCATCARSGTGWATPWWRVPEGREPSWAGGSGVDAQLLHLAVERRPSDAQHVGSATAVATRLLERGDDGFTLRGLHQRDGSALRGSLQVGGEVDLPDHVAGEVVAEV